MTFFDVRVLASGATFLFPWRIDIHWCFSRSLLFAVPYRRGFSTWKWIPFWVIYENMARTAWGSVGSGNAVWNAWDSGHSQHQYHGSTHSVGEYLFGLYHSYVMLLWVSHKPLIPSFTYKSLLFLLPGVCTEFDNFYLQCLGINQYQLAGFLERRNG